MNRSEIKPINTLSGSDFYRKIIKKYQISKINNRRIPTLIFYKNKKYSLNNKIAMSILFQMHLINQNVLLPLIVRIIHAMRGILSRLDTKKNTSQAVLFPKNIQNANNVKNFLTSDATLIQQATHIVPSRDILVNPQILHYFHNIKILNSQVLRIKINGLYYRLLNTIEHSTSFNKEAKKRYQSKSLTVLSQGGLFFNSSLLGINTLSLKYLNPLTVSKPLIKNYYYILRNSFSNFIQRTYPYKMHYYDRQSKLPEILPKDKAVCHFFCKIITFNRFFSNKFDINRLFSQTVSKKLTLNLQQIRYTVNKPLIENHFGIFRPDPSSPVQRTYAYKTGYYGSKSKSIAVLSQGNLFSNSIIFGINKLLFNYDNLVTVNKPLVKNGFGSYRYDSFSSVQRTYPYKTENEIMCFKDSGCLEQEIEQIKKIVIQTKESMSEKLRPPLGEAEIKQYIDINRISDQVYQNLERTIRLERERRGI